MCVELEPSLIFPQAGEDFTFNGGRGAPICRRMEARMEVAADPRVEPIEQAMAKRVCVTALYNRGSVLLAPHSLFERHGELYLRAVRLEYEGRKPREPKLGTFKLSGLSAVAVTRKLFARSLFAGLA